MVCLPEYKAGRAIVGKTTRVGSHGPGTVHYVLLPDGYLIECGLDEKRAAFLRDAVNVVMKWADEYPPIGIIDSIVKYGFQDEQRYIDRLAKDKSQNDYDV